MEEIIASLTTMTSNQGYITMTGSDLKNIKPYLINPPIQTDLNEEHIDAMLIAYKRHPHHFLQPIIVAHQTWCDKHILIDGQHRVEMYMKLLEQNIDSKIPILIVNVETEEEFQIFYQNINTDSSKCNFNNFTDSDKKLYQDLKVLLAHPDLPTISSQTNTLYTLSELVEFLVKTNKYEKYVKKTGNASVSDFRNYLLKKEKHFFKKCYSQLFVSGKDVHCIFDPNEIKLLGMNSCMFCKNNNFKDWLCNNKKITPRHYCNNYPETSKDDTNPTWLSCFGNNLINKVCPIACCNTPIKKNYFWQNCSKY